MYYSKQNNTVTENLIGGKAWNLDILTKNKIKVPKWFVISTGDEINDNLNEKIKETIKKLNMQSTFFAVRSSAIGEDNKEASFAGQLESFLFVKEDDIFENVKKVIASAQSKRNLFYREQKGLETEDIKVAVIVQEMIDADVSGVAFSANPITQDLDSILISSVFGLGEGLVSGELNADTYEIKNDIIEKNIVEKPSKIVFDFEKGYGTKIIDVDNPNQETLSEKHINDLVLIIKKIENIYDCPQGIEWAIKNNELYILQARPITTLKDKEQEIIWDNSNIIESYSGVTTPLTFSFIKDVYTEVYKQFLLILGVEKDLIERNNDCFQMLGLINGRVYYNLLSWYKVLMMLPGYEINASFMESMMGVKQKLNQKPKIKPSNKNKYLRIISLVCSLISNLTKLDNNIKEFYSHIDKTLSSYENTKLENYSSNDLVNIFYELEDKLLKNWQAPLVNDFYAMIFYGLLKKNLLKIDEKGTLQNDLLSGESGIISTEPIRLIKEISNKICENEDLKEFFINNSEEEICKNLNNFLINNDIQNFVKKFGNRCIGELKLETITYKQDIKLLIYIIKSYVKQGYIDVQKEKDNEKLIRKNAESTLNTKIKNPIKKVILNYVLNNARQKVKNRENLRFERTRLYGLVREIFLAIGLDFANKELIETQRDIFYLTKEEIFNYILGTSANYNLKELIEYRKKEFKDFENKCPDDRFSTYGIVYKNEFNSKKNVDCSNGDLSGIGCCPGIVKAKVRIVKDVSQSSGLEGCIMVAERTDPGWVPLFPISKGLLVERGSILSHSAIVAREMGIPAIVGINNLLSTLKDGDIVEMDGSSGIMKIIGSENG